MLKQQQEHIIYQHLNQQLMGGGFCGHSLNDTTKKLKFQHAKDKIWISSHYLFIYI
jgi:hypothetical protein